MLGVSREFVPSGKVGTLLTSGNCLPVSEKSVISPSEKSPQPQAPRNIIHARPRLLQIAANGRLQKCCEVLTRFVFRRKMVYLCTSEEEKALNKRVFSSFFWPKKGIFTSEVGFSTLLRKIFLGVCGFFLRNVGVRDGDSEAISTLYL